MSNRDRAAEIIYQTLNPRFGDFGGHEGAADALDAAGLLAPDLPKPDIEGLDGDKLREVLDRLDREYVNVFRSNPLPRGDGYTAGYLAGIDTAHTWIKQARGDTDE